MCLKLIDHPLETFQRVRTEFGENCFLCLDYIPTPEQHCLSVFELRSIGTAPFVFKTVHLISSPDLVLAVQGQQIGDGEGKGGNEYPPFPSLPPPPPPLFSKRQNEIWGRDYCACPGNNRTCFNWIWKESLFRLNYIPPLTNVA